MKTSLFLLLLACRLAQCDPNPVEELQVETLVSSTSVSPSQLAAAVKAIAMTLNSADLKVKPETCSVLSTMGDSLRIHYTVRQKRKHVWFGFIFLLHHQHAAGTQSAMRAFSARLRAARGCLCGTVCSVRALHNSVGLVMSVRVRAGFH